MKLFVRLLREPLAHFLVLGAAIFAVFGLTRDRAGEAREGRELVVTQGRIESLAATFARAWQRPPTQPELDGLIRDYVREEIAAREAAALGLDQDDTIIRRRLRQKLEFVADDLVAQIEPTDDDLRAYLTAHPDDFRLEGRVTFDQIFLDPGRRGDRLAADAAALLTQLSRPGSAGAATMGDSLLLDHTFEGLPPSQVAAQFGDRFAAAITSLPVGQWHGLIESGYGAHLVLVRERTEGRLPDLDEVRHVVKREWAAARRAEATDRFYESLLERYAVTIEEPAPKKESLAGTAP
jgi:hypothetical protein